MGLLDKFKKGGGGFLNNVDGLVTGLLFTTEIPGGGEASASSKFTSLFARVTAKVDGAEAEESTSLFAGSADDFVIGDDGVTLEPIEGATLWGGTAFGRFYASMVANGFADIDYKEGDNYDFGSITGARVRFVQVKDEEAMERAAKKWKTSKGKINELGQRKGKDGKFYDQRTLEVSAVYSTGNSVTAAPAKKTAGKTAAPKAAAGKKAAPVVDETELRDFTKTTLMEVIDAQKTKTLPITGINVAVTRRFQAPDLKADDRRDSVRKLAQDDALIAEMVSESLITSNKGVLSLAQ